MFVVAGAPLFGGGACRGKHDLLVDYRLRSGDRRVPEHPQEYLSGKEIPHSGTTL